MSTGSFFLLLNSKLLTDTLFFCPTSCMFSFCHFFYPIFSYFAVDMARRARSITYVSHHTSSLPPAGQLLREGNSGVQIQPVLHKSALAARYPLVIKKYVACSCATLDIQSVSLTLLQFPPPFLFGIGTVFVCLEVLIRPPSVLESNHY